MSEEANTQEMFAAGPWVAVLDGMPEVRDGGFCADSKCCLVLGVIESDIGFYCYRMKVWLHHSTKHEIEGVTHWAEIRLPKVQG